MTSKLAPASLLCAAASLLSPLAAEPTPYNVLLITVDDFRPELPVYGRPHIHAPNMTRLSNGGLTFNRAYVQQAICQPARANVLTGARPDTTRIYNVFEGGWPTFRTTMGAVDTLPGVFKNNGYWTAGYGKNFHHVDNPSWTVSETFYTTEDLYQDPVNRAIAGDVNTRPAWENHADGVEDNYMDAKVATAAAQAIRARAADGTPFFIGAGFWKPHLPFTAPKAYWDLYDRDTLPIASGVDALPPRGALPVNFYDPYSGELTTYKGGRPPFVAQTPETQTALANGSFTTNQQTGADWGIITVNGTHIYPEDYVRSLTHGYYACTSFIDAQIGKLLDALEDPNGDGDSSDSILDNTIIVLWGDHGFQLGQHGSWPKHTNMDISTRFPLILHHPDMPAASRGVLTNALVESVDIMPTILELAGLPAPATHSLEGKSLAPLMGAPQQAWKTAAFSQYPKQVNGVWYMGYAMRTATHTYMQWREMDATDANPISLANRNFSISNRVAYEELYDMVADPRQHQNIGGDPRFRPLMDALGEKLAAALSTNYANTQNVAAATAAAPAALAVAFHGGTSIGDTLGAHYIYADANGDVESGTTLEWLRASAFNGPYTTVVGTGSTYTLQAADAGAFVKLRVTPKTSVTPVTGGSVLSATAVVAGTGFDDGAGQPAPDSAVYEGFDYAAGVISSASAGGRGWASGWWGNDGLSFGANSGSQAVDFVWNNLPAGYHHTPVGSAASNGANANNPFRQLHGAQTLDLSQDATRHFSFLYRHNGSAPVFETRFHAGTTEVLKLQINAAGSLGLISADETKMGLLTLEANSAYVVLGRIQSAASGNDTLSVSIYKSGDTVPDAPPVFAASVNVASSATLDRIFFGNPVNSGNLGNSHWDEFHMDTSYTAVAGTPGEEEEPDPEIDPSAALILHLTFDNATLADSSPSNLSVTGSPGFASSEGRSYATLNGVNQHLTVPMIRSFPNGLTIAFWTYAQDGENGMPKNSALGWARQGATTGSMGDGVLLGFGWDNSTKALVRMGRENNQQDGITLPELTGWLNTWVHWTVVKNPSAGTLEVYRDGQLYSSVGGRHIVPAFESQSWMTGAGYRIGSYYDGVFYKGYLDDYRIYETALGAAAVQTIYQQGAASGPTAFNVGISGTPSVGEVLTGTYDFVNPGGTEGVTRFQWYRAATLLSEPEVIPAATAASHTVSPADDGAYLLIGVTPVGHDASEGAEAFSGRILIGDFVDRSLANSVRRLSHDKALNVVFFGGSITDGAGQNNGLPWRTRAQNWLSASYPDVTFHFTNASISGTTSEFGVFRTDRHVLSAEPDLVLVEFAVNDIELPSTTRTRHTVEGIVRKIRAARPACDIVFVYTTTRANAINYYEQGQLPPRTAVHHEVAAHYGLPSIDVAAALVAHKQQTGYPYRIEFGQPGAFDPAANHYLPDHVHPSNLGHQIYGDTVNAALATLLGISPPAALAARPMPELLGGYDMRSARILDHTHAAVTHGDGWTAQALGIGAGGRTDSFLVTTSASTASNIGVRFRGSELGVYYRRMTTGGQIAWDVDNGAAGAPFSFWHETLTSFTSQAMLTTTLGEGNHAAVITPQAFNGHETLAIAGWLVMGEFATAPQLNYNDWADNAYAHLEGGSSHPDAAPEAIPPGSRLTNLQIFSFGGTPDNPPPAPEILPATDYPELSYSRRIDQAAAPLVQHNTDLRTDAWSSAGLSILSVTPIDSIREQVRVRSPQTLGAQPLQFFGLRVDLE